MAWDPVVASAECSHAVNQGQEVSKPKVVSQNKYGRLFAAKRPLLSPSYSFFFPDAQCLVFCACNGISWCGDTINQADIRAKLPNLIGHLYESDLHGNGLTSDFEFWRENLRNQLCSHLFFTRIYSCKMTSKQMNEPTPLAFVISHRQPGKPLLNRKILRKALSRKVRINCAKVPSSSLPSSGNSITQHLRLLKENAEQEYLNARQLLLIEQERTLQAEFAVEFQMQKRRQEETVYKTRMLGLLMSISLSGPVDMVAAPQAPNQSPVQTDVFASQQHDETKFENNNEDNIERDNDQVSQQPPSHICQPGTEELPCLVSAEEEDTQGRVDFVQTTQVVERIPSSFKAVLASSEIAVAGNDDEHEMQNLVVVATA